MIYGKLEKKNIAIIYFCIVSLNVCIFSIIYLLHNVFFFLSFIFLLIKLHVTKADVENDVGST